MKDPRQVLLGLANIEHAAAVEYIRLQSRDGFDFPHPRFIELDPAQSIVM